MCDFIVRLCSQMRFGQDKNKNLSIFKLRKVNRVNRSFEKNSPNFSKSSPNSLQAKKAKISTTKLNLKAQNIYIKPLLKP